MTEKNRTKKYEIDMCEGSILKKMLMFTIPLMCSSILQLLFNAADIVVVGRYAGTESLAAVGSNTSLINMLTNLFIGMSIGSNVLVAKYYGAKKEKEMSRAVHTSMMLSIYSGIILTIIGIVFAKQILYLMKPPDNVLELAGIYLRIYFLGMTATMIYNFGSAILRATGDTKRPLTYLLIAGIINVGLNLLFVIVFKLGVAGVALATVISQCVSAFLIVRCLIKEQGALRLEFRKLKVNMTDLLNILKIGLPAGFQGLLFSLSNVLIQSAVNSFGEVTIAGNSAASNIEGFVYFAMNAFYQATISFTSQNVGAGKKERINKILITAQLCVIVVGVGFGNIVAFFGKDILRLYSTDSKVIIAGMKRINIICRVYALCGMMDVVVGALRGMGYSIVPMFVSLIGACGLRIVWIATVFQIDKYHKISTVYASYPITWIITFLAHMVCFVIVKNIMKRKTEYSFN